MQHLWSALRGTRQAAALTPDVEPLWLDGRRVEMRLVPNARARRIILRMDKAGEGVRITLPPGVGTAEAVAFARRSQDWIRARLEARTRAVAFGDGALIPFRGEEHEIVHLGRPRGTVRRVERADAAPALTVAGEKAHMARRLEDWMKCQARAALEARCREHAQALSLAYKRIHIRDQTSRWGSCSTSGTLSFSWRLIMTPDHVLDYVAAHEVAHLAEMNHSKRFWRLVDARVPDMKRSRGWLRKHGPSLHLYGRDDDA